MASDIYKKIGLLRNKIDAIRKSETNPFFKSKYADINLIEKLVEPVEHEVGLTHIVKSSVVDGIQFLTLVVADIESGETLESTLQLILPKNDMQQLVAGHTYGRRGLLVSFYSLEAMDDDGNSLQKPKPPTKAQLKAKHKVTTDTLFQHFNNNDVDGVHEVLHEINPSDKKEVWSLLPAEVKQFIADNQEVK